MAKTGVRHTSQLTTRDKYTKVDFELGMTVEGKELPSASVLGGALEEAAELIQKRVTESFVVPPRVAPTTAVVQHADVQPVASQ